MSRGQLRIYGQSCNPPDGTQWNAFQTIGQIQDLLISYSRISEAVCGPPGITIYIQTMLKPCRLDDVVMSILLLCVLREYRLFHYALEQAVSSQWSDFYRGHAGCHVLQEYIPHRLTS